MGLMRDLRQPSLCRRRFVNTSPSWGWPRMNCRQWALSQLYVREARRMVSDYVMTEKNCRRLEIVPDSVGMGAYNMDSLPTSRAALHHERGLCPQRR